jgi:ribosome biogenesis GTPase / thiamine phosphate phosphatase
MSRMRGVVLRGTSGFYRVRTAEGVFDCKLRGRIKKERANTDLVVLGDEVEFEPTGPGVGVIEEVLPRSTRFSRLHPTSRGREIEDVLVANLDRLLVVFSASTPVMNPKLLDRFLAIAEWNHITPIVVANKIDAAVRNEAERAFSPYRDLGYALVFTSVRTGEGIDALRALLSSGISALTGPSGVGKSSLANALEPTLSLNTGAISLKLDKGMHTTRVAELHPLAAGGWLADTPGIRELAGYRIPRTDLARCFIEMRRLIEACAFNDCVHHKEPGCAIRAAVGEGGISQQRYESYLRQLAGDER